MDTRKDVTQTANLTEGDIRFVREALTIAAMAKPNPVWECRDALVCFERLAELIDHYVPKHTGPMRGMP